MIYVAVHIAKVPTRQRSVQNLSPASNRNTYSFRCENAASLPKIVAAWLLTTEMAAGCDKLIHEPVYEMLICRECSFFSTLGTCVAAHKVVSLLRKLGLQDVSRCSPLTSAHAVKQEEVA